MNAEFALKDLGPLHYFLRIEVHNLRDWSLLLSEQKYNKDLLTKSKMDKVKSIATPIVSGLKLSKLGSDTMLDPTLYKSVVGALQYAVGLRGFCDADWVADADDRRSTSGACVFLGPNLVSWWSKK